MAFNYPTIVYQARGVQFGCIIFQIFLLYANIDYIGTFKFIFCTAVCLYNLYVTARRWFNKIDGRYDFAQMVKESNTQVRLQYAAEVFSPLVLGLLVFLIITLPGYNFFWTLASCVQIAAAMLILALEVQETVMKK
ncbi:unnamed protein product [Cylicocyclus nassatus]|uniref:DUF7087 domain-containing protein n=1 Tax=Cylicocyclus nassatus TaxID=53992 RepID=A0AA36M0U3_CYLNA|nr:unnamed protein product [Cylicocyclus nassatus]